MIFLLEMTCSFWGFVLFIVVSFKWKLPPSCCDVMIFRTKSLWWWQLELKHERSVFYDSLELFFIFLFFNLLFSVLWQQVVDKEFKRCVCVFLNVCISDGTRLRPPDADGEGGGVWARRQQHCWRRPGQTLVAEEPQLGGVEPHFKLSGEGEGGGLRVLTLFSAHPQILVTCG